MAVLDVEIARLLIEGLFAIVLSGIGFFLAQISKKIEKLTDAIADVRVEMMSDFVTKEEWQSLREQVHKINDHVVALLARGDRPSKP